MTAPLSLDEATAQMTRARSDVRDRTRYRQRGRNDRVEICAGQPSPSTRPLAPSRGGRPSWVYEDVRLSFDGHYREASALSQRLAAASIAPGDRVAIATRNLPGWISAFWATVSSGAVAVPLNAWWKTDELIYGLGDSGAKLLFVDEERLERVRPRIDELDELATIVVISEEPGREPRLGDPHEQINIIGYDAFLGRVDKDAVPIDVAITPDDIAAMFYTSGTTGRPKGAVLSHRNIVTNLMNLFFAGQRATLRFGGETPDPLFEAPQAASLLNVPLFHATGQSFNHVGEHGGGRKNSF